MNSLRIVVKFEKGFAIFKESCRIYNTFSCLPDYLKHKQDDISCTGDNEKCSY
jgi:hypothetical protein